MSKKEKVKKFIEEHKEEIKAGLLVAGGTVLLGSSTFALGRIHERHKLINGNTAAAGLLMNKMSNNVLMEGDLNGLGKLSDISDIVNKGLKNAAPEGHLDDTVIGYMVYVKDKIKS